MFYHNPGRNDTTDVSSSSDKASVAPHIGNLTSDDEDSPKCVQHRRPETAPAEDQRRRTGRMRTPPRDSEGPGQPQALGITHTRRQHNRSSAYRNPGWSEATQKCVNDH